MNRRLIRLSILLILVSLSLTNPIPTNAQASNTISRFERSLDFRFFNECTGEIVSGIVDLKGFSQFTEAANGNIQFHIHDNFRGLAVGETSGIEYVGPQTDHSSFHETSNGTVDDTFTLNFRLLSKGRGGNIMIHMIFHQTIRPDGVITSLVDIDTFECRG